MSATVTIYGDLDGDRHYVNQAPGPTVVGVELPDGRTVDLLVGEDGQVIVRGYVTRPQVTANRDAIEVILHLPTLSRALAGEHARLTAAFTHPIGLDNLIAPDSPGWQHADTAARTIATLTRRDHATVTGAGDHS